MSDLRILAEGLRFPEGPVAFADGSVALVELEARRITRIAPDGAKSTIATVEGAPNGLAVGSDGALYLCNNGGFAWHEEAGLLRPSGQAADYSGGRIERIDPATGAVTRLYDSCDGVPLKGPNDLVFDGKGGFWFTDLGKVRARDRDHGGVYWAAEDGSRIVEAAYPVFGGGNGIGLSPDGEVLYVAETETGRLWAWDILSPGRLRKAPWPSVHGGRLLCQFPGFRRLDSLAVAASGNVVVATLVSGEITTVSPSGEIVEVVTMPDRMPTNICFGGPDLRTAYVTLSTTGRLAALPWSEPGLRLAFG
ncbi:SMP-30/gluconolactonase/LRE family protein [Pseudoroseomonas cervicalis]|uniref:SMP-30/Gluconolaconase/LRE-like region n=1 Tax=Pseudoroseomonas cervicalis ATCC 49957 TaxID=525371 RepID=D5RK50_9PROT|nr:SMP-30/gluconolactonase/LRE family protein [Pseudoroseomonas cervicalis]EFH12332.1 SMP-30/Gluconolaconase/LRE-like region [Pseudoroseomonas cervicalis ATCC 49957]